MGCTTGHRTSPDRSGGKKGEISVEVLFLGRDIGQLGQGCPPPSRPPCVPRSLQKKQSSTEIFFSDGQSGGAVVYGNFTQAPHCKTKKGHCEVWPTLGRSFISRQGHRSVGTGMSPPSGPPCVPRSVQKKQTSTEIFFSAINRVALDQPGPVRGEKGEISGEICFFCRVLGHWGQGCSPGDGYRGPCCQRD
jgi:hypothetical protein